MNNLIIPIIDTKLEVMKAKKNNNNLTVEEKFFFFC